MQIDILDKSDLYSEYAPYQYVEDMKEFIDMVCALNRAAQEKEVSSRMPLTSFSCAAVHLKRPFDIRTYV